MNPEAADGSDDEKQNGSEQMHNEVVFDEFYVDQSEGEPIDPHISSLVEEYLSTVRVRKTISGQTAALAQPATAPETPALPGVTSEDAQSPDAPAGAGARRREAEQELANLRRKANLYLRAKQYAEALQLFQRIYMLGNNDDTTLYCMGECEYHLGNLARAKDLLEQYLAVREGNVDRSVLARLTVIRRNLTAQSRPSNNAARESIQKQSMFYRADLFEE